MPQSLGNVVLHITFSTKERRPFLRDRAIREGLHAYVVGVLANIRCPSLITQSVEDHIHILCQLSRTVPIAALLEKVKSSASEWIKTQQAMLRGFYWQRGYAAFSVSQSNVETVRQYIANQEEHHRKMTFQEEFRLLLERHGIAYDERYVWD